MIAHPHGKLQYVEPLIEMGIMGIEVNFRNVTEEERVALYRMAEEDSSSTLFRLRKDILRLYRTYKGSGI